MRVKEHKSKHFKKRASLPEMRQQMEKRGGVK